jgi:hypothetical protein
MSNNIQALTPHPTPDKPYTLLYILGSGRCGSTLLDLLLNGHSDALGLGEVSTLSRSFKPLETTNLSIPTPQFKQCYRQFWQAVKDSYERLSGQSFESIDLSQPRWMTIFAWQKDAIETWVKPNIALYSCAHAASHAKILIDTSKTSQRLYLLRKSSLFDIRVIHLIRDGRAVVNSYIQRYEDFTGGLRVWITAALASFYLRKRFHKRDWLQIRYEDLATKPEETLRKICVFLGIDFEPAMLAYRSHPYFGIGGNPLVSRREGEDIALDERWKLELRLSYRLIFELTGGWLNRWYGY